MFIFLSIWNVALTGMECLIPFLQSLTRLLSNSSLSLVEILLLSEPEYVKDSAGNIVTATKTFTATATSGSETLEFTFDASKYAGEELVVFEDLYYKNVLITTHSDITDKDQTIEVSLLLHIKIAKMDGKNIKYVLKNAEITIYRAALDTNGELLDYWQYTNGPLVGAHIDSKNTWEGCFIFYF